MSNTYDYIIIGAGSAGCVLANRLSANPDTTVLLLEAGKDDNNPLIHMPAGINELVPRKTFNWHFWTKPDPNMGDRPMFWPRGKGLGGSSSINAMIYIRGHASDYDQWRQMGNTGWGYDDVLPYFKKSEHYEGGEDDFHGVGGPLNVTRKHFPDVLTETYLKASVEAGYKAADDFNGADQEGVGYYDFTIKNGNRHSASTAYLKPVMKRKNLTILTECHTLKITTDGKRATGVEYADGTRVKAKARKEVILSAGAVNSPQILLLSGIGPADELKQHGIDVVHDLQGVGKNLQDHLDCTVAYSCTKPISILRYLSFYQQAKLFLMWKLFGKGFGANGPVASGGFLKSDPSLDAPDLQLHFMSIFSKPHGMGNTKTHGFQAHVCQLRPQSRGEIVLDSADPMADPAIIPNYLSEPADMAVLKKGIEIVRTIFNQPAFDQLRDNEMWPGPDVKTDADLEAKIRTSAETIYHPVGTCKMGTDPMAVVDPELKVHGMAGLRVVDASIIPTLIGGNTNAPTIMIAEKAADMILAARA